MELVKVDVVQNQTRWTVEPDGASVALPGVAHNPGECGDTLAAGLVQMIPDDGKEHLVAVALNVHGVPLAWDMVSTGTVDSCPLYARDVYAWGLSVPGVRFVGVAHNHPSGDTTPSPADVSGTRGLAAAGRIIGLDLAWSLVVTHRNPSWSAIPLTVPPPPPGGEDETGSRPPDVDGPDEPGDDGDGDDETGSDGEPGDDEPGDETDGDGPGEADVPPVPTATPEDLRAAINRLIQSARKV
jgi:hypothetical protein